MDSLTRKENIEKEIQSQRNQEGLLRKKILWKDDMVPFDVYKIRLSNLVYNSLNGRIKSRTLSLEAKGHKIDVSTPDGKKIIEKFLWESKIDRNERTLRDLERHGQKEIGIITQDGVIIDGNRRAMLLNKIDKFQYFETIVLHIDYESDPLAIEKLETQYQMGEDEKLMYNPIEKYLKVKDLNQYPNVSVEMIAEWMNEKKSQIEIWLSTVEIMEDYLREYEYHKIYTRLENREDAFLQVNRWMENFKGRVSVRAFDGYNDTDVQRLKSIAFDYIRAVYEVSGMMDWKDLRDLASGNKGNHLFSDKDIWKDFEKKHFDKIQEITDSETSLDQIQFGDEPEKILKARDANYASMAIDFLKENFEESLQKLRDKTYSSKPGKLIAQRSNSIKEIIKNPNVLDSDSTQVLTDLVSKVDKVVSAKSPLRYIERVYKLLEQTNIDSIPEEDIDDVYEQLKKIQRLAYRFEKEI